MNSLQRFVRAQRERVSRNVRRVRAAVRGRLQRFVLGLVRDEIERDRAAALDELRDTLRAEIESVPDESDVERAIEEALESRGADTDELVERALESYDFEDDIRSALENYDFSDAIQSALEDAPDPADELANVLRAAADELDGQTSSKPRRKRR